MGCTISLQIPAEAIHPVLPTAEAQPRDATGVGKMGDMGSKPPQAPDGGAVVTRLSAAQPPPPVRDRLVSTSDEQTGLTAQYIEKGEQELNRLKAQGKNKVAFNRKLKLLDLEKVQHAQVLVELQHLLHQAAGSPEDSDTTDLDDRKLSTWTKEHLAKLKFEQCVDLVGKLDKYHKKSKGDPHPFTPFYKEMPNRSPLAVVSLTGTAVNMEPNIDAVFFPIDKQEVTNNAGTLFEFALDRKVFTSQTSGEQKNDKEALQKLLGRMVKKLHRTPEIIGSERKLSISGAAAAVAQGVQSAAAVENDDDEFLVLLSSPVNAVTLETAAKAAAHIPPLAAFYSYCYPYDFIGKPARDEQGHLVPPSALSESQDAELRTDAETLEKMGINTKDPFVSWLLYGGFVYFSYTYDILSINALVVDRDEGDTTGFMLNLGLPTNLLENHHHKAVGLLESRDRFKPTTHKYFYDQNKIDRFAWITPSEMLADTIFTKSGGFVCHIAEKDSSDDAFGNAGGRYVFFPVVPPTQLEHWYPTLWESPVHIPEYLVYYRNAMKRLGTKGAKAADRGGGKYAPDVSKMSYGDGGISALGISDLLGINEEMIGDWMKNDEGVEAIRDEFRRMAASRVSKKPGLHKSEGLLPLPGSSSESPAEQSPSKSEGQLMDVDISDQEDWVNFEYIVTGKPPAKGFGVMGNDGNWTERDKGRDRNKISLADFCQHPESIRAKLKKGEVLALRLYTSSSFRQINEPLRAIVSEQTAIRQNPDKLPAMARVNTLIKMQQEPQGKPLLRALLPATTYMLSTALKKLRVQHMGATNFKSTELWRGMKNLESTALFIQNGGAEGAPMSTTPDLRVVANYSKSETPLLLKIKIDSPMDHGADISWLSLFPDERECLYPPLTFLKPIRQQPIRGLLGKGEVITVKPSFPS
mmetsp:Transcript_34047/g.79752  ORF Transcript_34047/g.79752 Transcript_34047/m.79752 type:complete len:920 (-) Transcript_34047:91-2850(-)